MIATNIKSGDIVGDLTISDIDGIIGVKGYLFRYSDAKNKKDRDLHNQYWSKRTYLMKETYPIKGMPINFAHDMEGEFTRVGVGIVNFYKEDDIGLFIDGQLHSIKKWKAIIEEVNRKRNLNLSSKQVEVLAQRAFNNMKAVVSEVPLHWSMGAYPPTYSVEESTGHIDTAGIVEATLTPVPAEPKGVEVMVTFKSVFDELGLKELQAKKENEIKKPFTKNNKSNSKKENNMPFPPSEENEESEEEVVEETKAGRIQKAVDSFIKEIIGVATEESEKQVGEMDEEEKEDMKSILVSALQGRMKSDTGYARAMKSTSDKEANAFVAGVVKAHMGDIIGESISSYLDNKVAQKNAISGHVNAAFKSYRGGMTQTPKSEGAGSFEQSKKDTKSAMGQVEVVSNPTLLAPIFKAIALKQNVNQDHTYNMKAQNPYIGTLGGHLIGDEMSQTILDPLRAKVVTFGMGVTETKISGVGTYTVPKMTTAPTAFRPGINQVITPSEASFESITAFLRPLAAVVDIPRQMLMMTGTNVEQKIRDQVIESVRLQIDKEILEGVGAVTGSNTGAEIRGIKRVVTSDAAAHLVNLATNGRKPKYDDLISAEVRLSEADVELDQNTSGWIMHPRDRGTFRRTMDANGQPLLYSNLSEHPYEDLIGYKVATSTQIDNAQTTGTSTDTSDIYFGNWKYGEYVIGSDFEVILDEVSLANQLMIRFVVYVYSDFIVHYPEAFTIMTGVRA